MPVVGGAFNEGIFLGEGSKGGTLGAGMRCEVTKPIQEVIRNLRCRSASESPKMNRKKKSLKKPLLDPMLNNFHLKNQKDFTGNLNFKI